MTGTVRAIVPQCSRMPRRFASLCGALALAACTRHTPDTTARVDALMRAYSGAVPGAAVLVLRDGAPLIRRAYGLADLEQRAAATPATNYRLASMTKQFTAAAVLALMDEGRLSLDDAVRRWLPSLPAAADAVTLRQLFTHTSGLLDYEDLIPAGTTQQVHDADVLRLLESQNRTYFVPGTSYRYSNTGYALLALIVARASGKDFATFLRERIFVPLGMTGTVAYEAGVSRIEQDAQRAAGTATGPDPLARPLPPRSQ